MPGTEMAASGGGPMVDVAGAVDDPARVEITHVERGDAFQAPDRIRIADIRFDPLDEPRAEDRVVRDFQAKQRGAARAWVKPWAG